MGDRFLFVGLGNPGLRYAGNRHNVGFMVLEHLAGAAGIAITRSKFKGLYGTGDFDGQSLVLLEPQTFMNLSGQAVSQARSFFDVEPARILVIHDELDLPFGTLRLKMGGGHAGHNGLRSIMAELGTGDFARLRVGIGRPLKGEVVDFVLQDFAADQKPWLGDLLERGTAALRLALQQGVAKAMNTVNQEPKKA
ncbi:aminoacyl-tRNA hydrolase [Myxococcota bacterium]|nr:aminoacyl-tRNA hydrolase [Myxococcota bacterium]